MISSGYSDIAVKRNYDNISPDIMLQPQNLRARREIVAVEETLYLVYHLRNYSYSFRIPSLVHTTTFRSISYTISRSRLTP